MQNKWKKHNSGCNGKIVLETKGNFQNEYRCQKCKSKIVKYKKAKT